MVAGRAGRGRAGRRTTGSAAGCCGRSARRAATPSASAPGGSSTTTGSRRSTSTPPRPRSTRRARCSTASTWPAREMARSSQAVVVEGYTDVMACHLAGVGTAVATCGTAFGDDHAKVLRRFLDDHEEFRGEVIFTFDGDAAGQKAALRAFGGDQNFVSQTYVAVEPDGLDPCDLRIKKGDAAVRELVARRVPLYRFVLANVVAKYDLDRADGRVDALRESARLVSSIRDKSKVDAFAREIAGDDRRRRRGGPGRGTPRRQPAARPGRDPRSAPPAAGRAGPAAAGAARPARPAVRDRAGDAQAGRPAPDGRSAARPPTSAPTTSPTRPTAPSGSWSPPRADRSPAPATRAGRAGCATPPPTRRSRRRSARSGVEPLLAKKEPDAAYVAAHVVRLHGADRAAPDRRDQVQAAAHQPGRAGRRRTTGCSASWPPSRQHRRALRDRLAGAHVSLRRTAPPVDVRPGERVLAWAASRAGRCSPAPGTRSTSRPRLPGRGSGPVGAGRGRRLGPGHRGAAGQRGRLVGRGPRRAPVHARPSPAGCWSWSASGSPRASCCSGTSRSRGRAASASSPAGAPTRRPRRCRGSSSTTRASTRPTRSSTRPPRRRSRPPARRSATGDRPADFEPA